MTPKIDMRSAGAQWWRPKAAFAIVFGAAIAVVSTAIEGRAQSSVYSGPMDVRRFVILQRAAANEANGIWAKVAYQEYINGLLEGLLDKEGEVFCLPASTKTGAVSDVFRQLTIDVEVSVRNARPSDFVSTRALIHFRRKYPC
jgi:hypothetical protein